MLLLTVCLGEGVAVPSAAPEAPWSVSFYDGSGNRLQVWKASKRERVRFEFSPVQPDHSSTGLYSGGRAKKGRVDSRHTQEL